MAKKCIYCSTEINKNSVVDMCDRCMYQVWGEKMAKAIVENMERERDVGNLELGRVGESKDLSVEIKKKMQIVDFKDNKMQDLSHQDLTEIDKF